MTADSAQCATCGRFRPCRQHDGPPDLSQSPAWNGRLPLPDVLWSKVREVGECWVWTGSTRGGYGHVRSGGKNMTLHRESYLRAVGPIPEGLTLDHLCRNRACVRPDHLEPVTRRENTLRGTAPAAVNARKTHCKRGHAFSPDNTITYVMRNRGGRLGRLCRTCAREQRQAWYAIHGDEQRAIERARCAAKRHAARAAA